MAPYVSTNDREPGFGNVGDESLMRIMLALTATERSQSGYWRTERISFLSVRRWCHAAPSEFETINTKVDKEQMGASQAGETKMVQSMGWKHHLEQCLLFHGRGDIPGLEMAFDALKSANPPAKSMRYWQIRLAAMKGDFPAAIKCFQESWNKGLLYKPEVAESRLTQFYLQLEDHEAVMDCARHALAHTPSYLPPVKILAPALAESILDGSENRPEASTYQDHPRFKPLLYQVIIELRRIDPNQMRRFIVDHLDHLDAKDLSIVGTQTISSIPAAYAKYNSATTFAADPDQEQDPVDKVRLARMHAEQGNMEAALTLLSSIAASDLPEHGKFLMDLIGDMPPEARLTRPELPDNTTGSEIVIAETPNAIGTVIVFTGLADQALVSTKFLDRYFSALGLSAIYLRDEQRYLYLNGISELGKDLPETITKLKEILGRLNTKRLFTFGSSAGGYGAICYGLMLEAEAILCFSTVTHIHPMESRAKLLQKKILKIRSLEEFSLLNVLQDPKFGKPPIFLYYGEQMDEDRIQAEILGALENVSLHPITGLKSHLSIARFVREKRLLSLIAEHYRIN